ncbi:hypothetical protein ARNL5_01658 [Anaerolineae bacterium]|nr:hypothetical protein ARNL5_01658 [Anaerolineae bacterium]
MRQRTLRSSCLLVFAVLAAACGSEAPSANSDPVPLSVPEGDASLGLSTTPRAMPDVVPSPEDLMTSVDTTAPTLLVRRSALNVGEQARLLEGVSLVTWPERQVVASEAQLIDDQPLAAGAPSEHLRVVLSTVEPLADRWYALRIDPGLPTRQVGGGALPDGSAWYSRFRPGPQAVVRQVRLVREGSQVGVEVLLSERVRDPRPDTALLTTGLASCSSGEPTGESEEGSFVLRVWCEMPASGPEVVVELARDIRAVTGGFVTDLDRSAPRPMRVSVPVSEAESYYRPGLGASL